MIRKDPQSIRKANPAFANISDEQIMAYADQLEQVHTCIYIHIYINIICVYVICVHVI
jgi:hypothetical protein